MRINVQRGSWIKVFFFSVELENLGQVSRIKIRILRFQSFELFSNNGLNVVVDDNVDVALAVEDDGDVVR